MAHLRLLLLCVLGTGFAYAGQLDKVNKVILSDIESGIEEQGISKLDYIKKLVDGAGGGNKLGAEVVQRDDVKACTELFNETLCSYIITQNCYDVKRLLTSALGTADFNISDAFPTLVYHMYQPRCESEAEPEVVEDHEEKMPIGKAWGYGLGFCALICFISNIGGLMQPCMKQSYFQRILLFFVALAVGTLASTGFLVLVPESMHLTGDDSPVPDYNTKMVTVMGGVYFFYMSELIMNMWFERKTRAADETVDVNDMSEKETEKLNNSVDHSAESRDPHGHSHFPKAIEPGLQPHDGPIATVAWMILIGDALHNFVDGISIGAAFTENTALGVSVSIAILCEELPHELGDISILLHAGLSMKRALLYNFLAAIVCFAGLVIGIMVGENTDANSWIFAVAGGMFIYISLVDMVPEMRQQAVKAIENKVETPFTALLIQNLGLIVGFLIIASLVFFY